MLGLATCLFGSIFHGHCSRSPQGGSFLFQNCERRARITNIVSYRICLSLRATRWFPATKGPSSSFSWLQNFFWFQNLFVNDLVDNSQQFPFFLQGMHLTPRIKPWVQDRGDSSQEILPLRPASSCGNCLLLRLSSFLLSF